MNLGFHYHTPAKLKDDQIIISSPIGLFIDSLAAHFSKIYLFLHKPDEHGWDQLNYEIESKNIQLVQLSKKENILKRVLFYNRDIKILDEYKNQLDFFVLRGPSPLIPAFSNWLVFNDIRYSIYLVGDYLAGLKGSDLSLIRKIFFKLFYTWLELRIRHYLKKGLPIFNTSHLLEKYSKVQIHGYLVKSTTLHQSDLRNVEIRPKKSGSINILFSGRIDYSKGLDTILRACILLWKQGLDIKFSCVGPVNRKGAIFLETLNSTADVEGFGGRFTYLGLFRAGSPDLISIYQNSFIFCIGSRSDFEGFPRVIWEAFNFSVPVIARAVGSIPYFIEDKKHALLVYEDDAGIFASKIQLLLNDEKLRKELILNGRELIGDLTLENQAHKYVHFINNYCKDRRV